MSGKKRVAILISGRGSNMSALINAAKDPKYPAEIVGVFSNRQGAPGLAVAAAENIATAWRSHREFASRADFDAAIDAVLSDWAVDYVCLAGFMRIFSDGFARKWTGRMINIHPSLLPKYKGLAPHRQALADGARVHGCTVHWVIPELDAGPTILQAEVPVLADDTEDSLAARVLAEEHRLYPRALAMLARGQAALP